MIEFSSEEKSIIGNESQSFSGAGRYLGWMLLQFASYLIIGVAYRLQSNMINAGLLFLSFGVITARPNLGNRLAQLKLTSLAAIGAAYSFLT